MKTFVHETEYRIINCGQNNGGCGTSFAVTRSFYDHIQATGQTWYCPKGHPRVFSGPTDSQKLADAEAREVALQDQLSAAIRDGEETRVALLRDRARFAAGVCPCCNRSFENVRRHMNTKRPDYDVTAVSRPAPKTFRCSCGSKFETLRGLRIHQGHARKHSVEFWGVGWDEPSAPKYRAHLTEVSTR